MLEMKQNMNKYPLNLPKGSVRAILIIAATLAALVSVFFDVNVEARTTLFSLASIGWGYYFSKRQIEDK